MYPAIIYTQKQRFDIYFHSQPCILLITSHFDVIFIIIMCDERQNVVIKSNILTMLIDLKSRTIFISTRDRSIPLLFCNWSRNYQLLTLSEQKSNKWYFDGVDSNVAFSEPLSKKNDLLNYDFWRSNIVTKPSPGYGTRNIYRNYAVSADMFMLPIFYDIVRLF